jgi:hypothetical protein
MRTEYPPYNTIEKISVGLRKRYTSMSIENLASTDRL